MLNLFKLLIIKYIIINNINAKNYIIDKIYK
jgi:hypothetical protein